MPVSERHQDINNSPSRLARFVRSKPFLYSGIMSGIAGAAIMGGRAHAESHIPVFENDIPSHVLQIKDVKTTHLPEAQASIAKKTIKVVIEQRGESLTEATAKATGETQVEAFKILEANGLEHNDLVYLDDTFNVEVSGGVKTVDTTVKSDTASVNTQASSESKSVDQAHSAAASVSTNKSESIAQAPATQTPDNPKSTATPDATSTKEPAAASSTSKPDLKDKATPTPTIQTSKNATTVASKGAANTVSASETATNCSINNLNGNFDWAGDSQRHLVYNPSTFHLKNSGTADCPNTVWMHAFATNEPPKLPDGSDNPKWLISQRYVSSESYNIDPGAQDQRESFDLQNIDECYAQEDLTRTGDVRVPPYYNPSDNSIIDYGIWENPKCKVTPTVTSTATFTVIPDATQTGTATNTPLAGCIDSDVKGELNDLADSNHLTGMDVTGKLSNVSKNPNCPNDIYIHMYGSMEKPTGTGQNIGLNIESQKGNHILTKEYNVPANTVDQPIEIMIPKNKFCTVQVDLTRDGVIKDEPRYLDNDFLLFVDEENCNPKTATSTPSNTATSVVTFIPARTNTPVPPTETNTPETPTNTATNTAIPTNTPKHETPVVSLPKTGNGPDKGRNNLPMFEMGIIVLAMAEAVRRNREKFTRFFAKKSAKIEFNPFEQRLLSINSDENDDDEGSRQ